MLGYLFGCGIVTVTFYFWGIYYFVGGIIFLPDLGIGIEGFF